MRTTAVIRAEIAALETELAIALRTERETALEQIQSIMTAVDISLPDLHAMFDKQRHKPPRASAPAKYRHPDGRIWTGQGRMPNWLVGQDLEQFRVKPAEQEESSAAA